MNYTETAGRTLLGLGALGLGFISLLYADFAITWQPVPDWVPARSVLAYASGAALAAAGVALIVNRGARVAAAFIAAFLAFWGIVLQAPKLLAGEEAAWLAPAEILAVAAGAWILFWVGSAETPLQTRAVQLGTTFFGLMLPIFGVAHFLYIAFTALMIPEWIPYRVFWAWFTGAGHVAAGLSIALGVIPRIGATLLATMFSGFVLLVHVPRVIADTDNRLEWHLLSTALLLTGAAWIVASALSRRST
ncbi:MAG: hypothetical protein ABL871_06240 [Terricaulis sp.]